jgi:hypothetical protein
MRGGLLFLKTMCFRLTIKEKTMIQTELFSFGAKASKICSFLSFILFGVDRSTLLRKTELKNVNNAI